MMMKYKYRKFWKYFYLKYQNRIMRRARYNIFLSLLTLLLTITILNPSFNLNIFISSAFASTPKIRYVLKYPNILKQ